MLKLRRLQVSTLLVAGGDVVAGERDLRVNGNSSSRMIATA